MLLGWGSDAFNQAKDDSIDLQEIKSQLPSKIHYEYANHKLYSGDHSLTFKKWKPWDQWDYPAQDLIRFKHLLLDNVDIIKNKTIIDFACFLGFTSFSCLHLGASHVTATNIIKHQLDIADELMQSAEFTDYKLILADIHDTESNTKICNKVDTVILAGIMYHLHDHYRVLESILSAQPDNIIIDPPRAGIHNNVIDHLLELEVPKITYVSCNPTTMARDCELLSAKYDIIKIKPVDMFPQTYHIEAIAQLRLKK